VKATIPLGNHFSEQLFRSFVCTTSHPEASSHIMSQSQEQDFEDDNWLNTYGAGYRTFGSTSHDGNVESISDQYHHNFLSFLSISQQLQVDFMNITWQPALQSLGFGGSSEVAQSNLITKQLSFAFKRTVPRRDTGSEDPIVQNKQRYRSLICEILVLRNNAILEHSNITRLEGIAWEFQDSQVWPVLVFSKVNAGNLQEFICSDIGMNISFEATLRICIGVAAALHVLHENSVLSYSLIFDYDLTHHRHYSWRREASKHSCGSSRRILRSKAHGFRIFLSMGC
jgi:hypothetical protein